MSTDIVFSDFTSRPISLLAINKVSVFILEVCVFSSNKLTSPAADISGTKEGISES